MHIGRAPTVTQTFHLLYVIIVTCWWNMFLNMDHGQKFGKSLHSLMGICGFSPSQGPFFQFPSSSTPWYSFQQGQETLPLIGHSLGGAVHQGVPSFLGEKMVTWPMAGQSDDCSRKLESRGHTQGLKIVEDGSSTGGLWKLTPLFFWLFFHPRCSWFYEISVNLFSIFSPLRWVEQFPVARVQRTSPM